MAEAINLNDMECISSEGILHKYKRKSDNKIFTVKILIVSKYTEPEYHPVILNLEIISKFTNSCLPLYYGFATKKVEDHKEVYIFLEESEGSLADYLQRHELTKEQITTLIQDTIDVLMFVDKTANILPSYITPYNIIVTRDSRGELGFKLFGTLYIDSNGAVKEEDYKWMSPELYEKAKTSNFHQETSAEKSVFYSLGILAIFCATKELLTEGRSEIEIEKFGLQNEEKETEMISYARAKLLAETEDSKLDEVLGKLLTYSEKERPDFKIWQLKYRSLLGRTGSDQNDSKSNDWFNDSTFLVRELDTRPMEASIAGCGRKKDGCVGCNIF